MTPKLAENQIFTLRCDAIENAFDTFEKNGTGDMVFCHKFFLSDDKGITYPCQWCTDYGIQNFCKVGDMVKVQIKKFSPLHKTYTMVPNEVVNPETAASPKMEETYSQPYQRPTGESLKGNNNPNIAGTIYDRSMTLAIAYYKDNEVPFEKVETYADRIAEWFKLKLQQ